MSVFGNSAGVASAADLHARRTELEGWLTEWEALWRPQPFKGPNPPWCETLPALARRLRALSDAELQQLATAPEQLAALLAAHVPPLDQLPRLTALAALGNTAAPDCGPRLRVGIPGRKRAQIEAFAGTVAATPAPLMEWCGGKGHLGRLLAAQWQVPATTLEHNADLCAQGGRLAAHARVTQRFVVKDAMSDGAAQTVVGHHVVALHACGELHRTLVRDATSLSLPALDIAPCCYHHLSAVPYQCLCAGATLSLAADDLRLAVTDTVTSGKRTIQQRDQDMAWKLGFNALRHSMDSTRGYERMLPVPKRWLLLGFEGYCRELAHREGLTLPPRVNWVEWERSGWERQAQVMRLSLVRHAFRRAVELLLVMDLAGHLADQGYRVRLGTFCESRITPRNILISARA